MATENNEQRQDAATTPVDATTPNPVVTPEQGPGAATPFASDEDLEAQLAFQAIKRRREAKRRKRLIIIGVGALILLIAAVAWVVTSSGGEEGEEYDPLSATAEVTRGDFVTTVTANGATEPAVSTVVTPEVDGIIDHIEVSEGQQVNAGDVLFTIKNEELDKAVREASNQVDSAQRAANSADRAVDDAYAAYNSAWDACNAADDWSTFDEAGLRSAISTAEDAYTESLKALETAKTQLSSAQATADKRTVRAPASGTIVAMNAQKGAGVGSAAGTQGSSTSGPLAQISDLSQMKVTVQVNEVDISSVQVGQEAKATFSALPDLELTATVQRIASVSSGASSDGAAGGSSGGVVTYAVDLLIPEPDPALKPGMTATVLITTQSAPDSLIVPTSALVEADGKTTVSVITNAETGETKDVEVEVRERNNSEVAISPDGELAEGDMVVIGGEVDMSDVDLEGLDEA